MSINFGLRKKRKIEVPPQAFSDPDGESDEPNTVEDIEAQIRLLQVSFTHTMIVSVSYSFSGIEEIFDVPGTGGGQQAC